MHFELMIEWAAAFVALEVTIPLAIKIAPSIKKIVFKTKNGDALAQNSDINS